MTCPSWDLIQEIYHAAMALPHSERNELVVRMCGGDSLLDREINSLLEAADSLSGFLDSAVIKLGEEDQLIGTTIQRRYCLKRSLASAAGMSQVYLADDLNLDSHDVVIKILARHLADDPYAKRKVDQ